MDDIEPIVPPALPKGLRRKCRSHINKINAIAGINEDLLGRVEMNEEDPFEENLRFWKEYIERNRNEMDIKISPSEIEGDMRKLGEFLIKVLTENTVVATIESKNNQGEK